MVRTRSRTSPSPELKLRSEMLRAFLKANDGLYPYGKDLRDALEIRGTQWDPLIGGHGYAGTIINEARIFAATGIAGFDPRKIPPRKIFIPKTEEFKFHEWKMNAVEYRKFWNSWPGPLLRDGSRAPKAPTADPDYDGPVSAEVFKPQVETVVQTHSDASPSQSAQNLLMEIAAAALQGGVNVLAAQLATVLDANQTARDQRFAGSIAANLAPLLAANGRSEIVTALKRQSDELVAIRQLLQLTQEIKEIDTKPLVETKERSTDQIARELHAILLKAAKGSFQESNAFATRHHKPLVELLVLLEPFAVGGRDLEDKHLN